ncbi:MAG: ribbon-helix-helix protein, CopG family [Anaerolineales bacterium]
MHRAQILLDPEQHDALAEIAQRDGTSISEIVRTAVNAWLEERRQDESMRRRLEALDTIQAHRQALLDRRNGQPLNFDPADLIERMREERGDELNSPLAQQPK